MFVALRLHCGFGLLLVALILCLVVPSTVGSAETESKPINVVVLSFGNRDPASIGQFVDAFRARIEQEGAPLHIYLETLDEYGEMNDPSFEKAMEQYLSVKYENRKLDLVVAIGNRALDFLLPRRNRLYPQAKLLYVTAFRESIPDATGVILEFNLVPTIEIALEQNPDTKRLLLITGSSWVDQAGVKELVGALQEMFRRQGRAIEIETLAPMAFDDARRYLSRLPDGTTSIFVAYYMDATGQIFTPSRVLPLFSNVSTRPIYSGWDTDVGRGGVGGSVIVVRDIAQALALLASRVLRGEDPGQIPPIRGEFQHYLFDWQQMQRWGIRLDQLPPGSTVLNREYTAWELYKWYILGAISLILLETALILFLLRLRAVKRRAQQALEEQLTFEGLVTDISARFANLRIEEVDAEITRSLQQIAEFLGVDRDGFCTFSSQQGTLTSAHFYTVPGVAPIPPQVLHTQFPWYTSKVSKGEILRFECLPDGLPPEAEAEREYTIAVGMKAHLAIPIKVGGSVAYLLPVDSFRSPRPWPEEVVARLQLLGEIFAATLAHKSAQEALLESEAQFRLLAETATCGIGIYQNHRFQYVSPRATEITGYTVDEMLSMSVERLIHPDFQALVLERAQARLRGDRVPARYEIKILTKEGEERWVDFTAAMTQYKGHPAIIGTAFDVTERKRTEERLWELSGRLILAQEEERTRIARELHDDLSQRLALVTIGLEELGLQATESVSTRQLQTLSEQTKGIAAGVHQLSRQLHPSQLELLGLVAAVRSLCTELTGQKSMHIEFIHKEVPSTLPAEVTLCLYRIVQEALQNVRKHARTIRATVELTGSPEALNLSVADDGVGFEPDRLKGSGGLGLVSMRERVRLVHGEFAVCSRPGEGTHINVRIPLTAAPA